MEQVDLVLVTTFMPSQPWFPAVLDLACEPPLVLPLSNDLLTFATGEIHPLVQTKSILLIAWKLSGAVSVTRAFRESGQPAYGGYTSVHTLLTSRIGTAGVIETYKTVPIPCFLLTNILEFWSDCFVEGKAYRTIICL
jgi:hypothetical protein